MDHGQSDYLRALQAVILEDVDSSSKFWLTYFRDNLLAKDLEETRSFARMGSQRVMSALPSTVGRKRFSMQQPPR
jgi:hypothetical protein